MVPPERINQFQSKADVQVLSYPGQMPLLTSVVLYPALTFLADSSLMNS